MPIFSLLKHVNRFFLSLLFLITSSMTMAAPAFTITGIGDEAILENTPYVSNYPVVDGSIAGSITYSLLNSVDPFTSTLDLYAGKTIIEIIFILLADDSDLFTVDSTTGVVSMVPRDFEAPDDANADNDYFVTLVATDDAGDSNYIRWHVDILDQPPVVFNLTGISNKSLYENSDFTFSAPNLNGSSIGPITYSLSGNDASFFTVNPTNGVVSFSRQDYEDPQDADNLNTYEITLVGTDIDANTASISWIVSILNLPPLGFSIAPVAESHPENSAYTGPAPAISGSFRGPLTYELSGGDDILLFSISPTGVISLSAKDFSIPIDANADNIYEVTFTATDSDDNTATATLAVTITDVPIDPTTDSDGDGVPDIAEMAENTLPDDGTSFKDTDGDGIPDYLDADADNDSLLNTDDNRGFDPYHDNDGDGVPDYLDADDRGDGSSATCTDLAANNVCDIGYPLDPRFDSDQDGKPNHADFDSDNDYIPDALETAVDTDVDGIPDYLDNDSDNDYIPDIIESGINGVDANFNGIADYFDVLVTDGTDANNDGIDDAVPAIDSDNDGIPDYLDLDSDNDSIPDVLEGTLSTDTDNDGIDDQFDIDNSFGFDINRDGINDLWILPNTDGDHLPDYIDSDSDNDGIGDQIESGSSGVDLNNNGIDDRFDITYYPTGIDNNSDGVVEDNLPDSDGDGAFDHHDLDSDNDTIPDITESGAIDFNQDALNDGLILASLPLPDADGDSIPDYLDIDNNGVFVIAGTAFSAFDGNGDGRVDLTTDPDRDGIDNSVDNAPAQFGLLVYTPPDLDGDLIPDSVDPDIDGDSISNITEGEGDSDNDGVPDKLDRDSDNDGISDYLESGAPDLVGDTNNNGIDDSVDVLITGGNDANADGVDDVYLPIDTDSDGIPDYLDSDSDNDGIADLEENSGITLSGNDSDSDGIDDVFDVDETGGFDLNNDGIGDDLFPVVDSDNDGIPDYLDLDSDNDTISDALEGSANSDNDLLPDRIDTDSDGDGISDYIESGNPALSGDNNSNGIDDSVDVLVTGGDDDNNDGIDDAFIAVDTDNDNTPDYLDEDSDNDGISDSIEGSVDSDGDGTANFRDQDSDNDYLPDSIEGTVEHDQDGIPDYLDTDSDGDGIPDLIEGGTGALDDDADGIANRFDVSITGGTDANGDGIDDNATALDSDSDLLANYIDTDSDNDNIPDVLEATLSTDTDIDGIDDAFDVDITMGIDANNDGIDDSLYLRDTNGDGSPDVYDIDSDNDGIGDAVESLSLGIDANDNGIDDAFDAQLVAGVDSNNDNIIEDAFPDTDGDGVLDHHDLDSDNDSLTDVQESGGVDANIDGFSDLVTLTILPLPDADNDGIPDYRDLDSDDDGEFDINGTNKRVLDANTDGMIDITADPDNDGVDSSVDTLPLVYGLLPGSPDMDNDDDNISNLMEGTNDTDNDGIMNMLDLDSDNDGISDFIESGYPIRIGDTNNNGLDDFIDVLITGGEDLNADGVDDRFHPVDTDGDGIPDYLDTDADNDGLSDLEETSGLTLSGNDSDFDGIDDVFDVDNTGGLDLDNDGIDDARVLVIDTDNDGLFNHLDKDSDNDGFLDGVENDDVNNDGIPDRLQPEGKVKGSSGSGFANLLLLLLLAVMLAGRQSAYRRSAVALALLAVFNSNTYAEEMIVCRDYTALPTNNTAFAPCYYVGIGLGLSQMDPDTSDSSWVPVDDADSGFTLYGGYHFSRSWFVELMYANMGETTMDNKHVLVTDQESIAYQAFSVFGGYYLPFDDVFNTKLPVKFFIKGGPALLALDASSPLVKLEKDSQTVLATGMGIEWPFVKNWMLRAEMNTFSAEAKLFSLSVGYWFGGQTYRYDNAPPQPVMAETTEAVAVAEPVVTPEPVAEEVVTPEEKPVLADADFDGVNNEIDECPNSLMGSKVDAKGCAVYKGYVQSLYGAFNSTDLTYPSYGLLDTVILLLKGYPDTRIEIQAHTDDRGSDELNQRLSDQRAEVVKAYLVEKGIDASRIETKGFGESKPMASNETVQGRSKNRRIDFKVLNN
jgi:outer membrane protein OmpA-like peptidoglycan-associated protein